MSHSSAFEMRRRLASVGSCAPCTQSCTSDRETLSRRASSASLIPSSSRRLTIRAAVVRATPHGSHKANNQSIVDVRLSLTFTELR